MEAMLIQNILTEALQPLEHNDVYSCKQDMCSGPQRFIRRRHRQDAPSWEESFSHVEPKEPENSGLKRFSLRPKIAIKMTPGHDVYQINSYQQSKRVIRNQPRISSDLRLPSVFKRREITDYNKDKYSVKQTPRSNYQALRQGMWNLESLLRRNVPLADRAANSLYSPVKIMYPNRNKQNKQAQKSNVSQMESIVSTRESSVNLPNENPSDLKFSRNGFGDYMLPNINNEIDANNSKILERLGVNHIWAKLPDKIGEIYNDGKDGGNSYQPVALPLLKTQSKISLAEMVTLKQVSRNRQTIKRVFHGPTMKIYKLQEGPVESNEYFEEWTVGWKRLTKKEESRDLVKIFDCFWDYSRDRASILMEATRDSTLQDIIDYNATLPENCIQLIAGCVIRGLNQIHSQLKQPHGAIKASEILFDTHCNPKLSPGIEYRASYQLDSFKMNLASRNGRGKGEYLYQNHLEKKPRVNHMRRLSYEKRASINGFMVNQQQHTDFSSDIFDLGYLLLVCALGNLSIYDPTGFYELDNLKWLVRSVAGSGDFCCLLHSEHELRKYYCEHSSTVRLRGSRSNKFREEGTNLMEQGELGCSNTKKAAPFTLLDLLSLNSRFSDDFIDFLCECLQICPSGCLGTQQLINHAFINPEDNCADYPIRFSELIQIREQAQSSRAQNQEYQLYKVLDAVMAASSGWNRNSQGLSNNFFDRLQNEPQKLEDLAAELGVSKELILDKLEKYAL